MPHITAIKKASSIVIWMMLISSFACDNSTQHSYKFDREYRLEASRQIELDLLCFQPSMSIDKENLVVFNNRTEDLINIFDLNTGQQVNRYLNKGDGPGEIVSPRYAEMFVDSNYIQVEDRGRGRIYSYEICEDSTVNANYSFVQIPDVDYYFKSCYVNDSTYISVSTAPDRMYDLVRNNKIIDSFFEYPEANHESEGLGLAYAYQGIIRSNKEKSKFYYATTFSDIFELYDFDGEKLTLQKHYQTRNPLFRDPSTENSRSVVFEKENKLGFMSSSFTNKYIYLLYSGRNRLSHPNDYLYANEVFVINWNGDLICKLILDTGVLTICVNKDDSKLYGIKDSDDGSTVVAYDLDI